MPSLKKNLLYSVLLVVANYVFPFLTYPYVSRVLGVTGIGACNFVDSVINYFILFATLGVDTYGIREVAKHKGDKVKLDRIFSSIFLVHLILTAIMLLLLVISTLTVPQLIAHKDLMLIGGFKLVFNCLMVEWLYKGLEDFKLITLRSVVVKSIYVVAVFILVRERGDIWLYYLLSTLMVIANALVNIVFARRKVSLVFSGLDLKATFRSLIALGVYLIMTSMYTTFNTTFLGFVSGETEVGYYSNATKIYYMVMAVFTAFTSVMIPRMSELVSSGETERFKSFFQAAVDILFGFSFPIIIWMVFAASDIVRVIAGPEFGGSVLPMQVIAPLVFIIGYEQILALQTLLPLGKDKILLRNSVIGAILGVVLNCVLVPFFASLGASIVWIVTEVLVLVLSQIAVYQELRISFPIREIIKNIGVYLPLVALLAILSFVTISSPLRLVCATAIVGAYIFVYQVIIRKNELLVKFR